MPKRKPSSNPITDHFKSQRYTHNQLSGLGDSMARGHYFNMVDRTQRWLNRTENQVNALYSQNKLPSGCYHSSSTGSSTSNENSGDRPDHHLDGSSNHRRDPTHLRWPDSGRALLEKMICEHHSKTTSQPSACSFCRSSTSPSR